MTRTTRFLSFVAAFAMTLTVVASPLFGQETENQEKVGELMQQARIDLSNEDYDSAAENFAKVVKLAPKNALAWHLHGYALHSNKKLDEAIKSHKKAAELAGENQQVKGLSLYNLGCAYSLKKEKQKALDFLDKAIDAGMLVVDSWENDPDLEYVRDEKRFAEMVKIVKAGGRKKDATQDKQETTEKKEAADKKGNEKLTAKSLAGNWKVTKGIRGGEKIDATRLPPTIKIEKGEFHLPAPDGQEGFVMSFKIDNKKSPAQIDLKIEAGPVPEGKALGILKMDGDKLILCYDPMGQERPKKFESTEENGLFMFVMSKIEKDGE